jgi:pimeloyl-ACP methyl ester carboxylesterase
VFVEAVFGGPLRALGISLHAVRPRRGSDVVAGYRAELDDALDGPDPLVVGGISLGAHVAATWAAERRVGAGSAVRGLLLALPAWTGPAADAPAAQAAGATAALVRSGGVAAAVAAARAGSPPWLAAELARAWPHYGAGLAAALDAAAAAPGPDEAALRSLTVPAGIAAVVDDPVHPLAVARRWQHLLPSAVLHTATLAAFGTDPAVLGRAAVRGWLGAAHAAEPEPTRPP